MRSARPAETPTGGHEASPAQRSRAGRSSASQTARQIVLPATPCRQRLDDRPVVQVGQTELVGPDPVVAGTRDGAAGGSTARSPSPRHRTQPGQRSQTIRTVSAQRARYEGAEIRPRPWSRRPAGRQLSCWICSRRPRRRGSARCSPARPPPRPGAWQAIAAGENALVIAPTGSGKTLAAFLWALDELTRSAAAGPEAALPGALRLAAEGAGGRRRAQPARPAGRDHPDRPPARPGPAQRHRRRPVRRHLARRPAGHRQPARRTS